MFANHIGFQDVNLSIYQKGFNTPALKNETESSANGFCFNISSLVEKYNEITKISKNVETYSKIDYVADFEDTLIDFNSDDSIKDPDFNVESDAENSDSSVNSEIIAAGKILEENLMANTDQLIESNNNKKYDSKKEINRKRNLGLSYVRKSGSIPEKRCIPLQNSCRKNCKEKINFSVQKEFFNYYWALGSYNKRLLYMSSLIIVEDKKTQTLRKNNGNTRNRQHSAYYFIEKEKSRINVCQQCFLKIFGETVSFVKTVQRKKLNGAGVINDQRGQKIPPNKLSEQIIESIIQHINSFPAYESHYTRRDTSKKYLCADLNISKMHQLYLENYRNNVSLSAYSKIFQGKTV